MKPYYQDKYATIYHGDCLEIMPELEPESVDLIIADPFYVPPNIFKWKNFDDFYWAFNKKWLLESKRILKKDFHMFIFFHLKIWLVLNCF